MIDNKDRQALALALDASSNSTFGRVKIGAVVMSQHGLFLGRSWNQRRTHPRQYEANKRVGKQIQNPCLHAEIAAIIDAEQYIKEEGWPRAKLDTIYVARLDRNGKFANCKPCAACHSEIVAAGIKRVVFLTEEGVKEYNVSDKNG